nr:non-ribosomal peptide synthetase [Vibrio sinus]
MTNAQRSVWTIEQILDQNVAYTNPLAVRCRIKHDFELVRVQAALTAVANQHDIFRTTIQIKDDEPCQCLGEHAAFPLTFDDISNYPEQEKEAWVKLAAKEEGTRHFDLTKGPLAHCRMVKIDSGDYAIMFTFHHIISDGWTMSLCFKHFMTAYFSKLDSNVSQFTSYALEESQFFKQGRFDTGLNYWKEKLTGAAGVLDIPTDRPRPEYQSFSGSYVSQLMDSHFWQKLQTFAVQQGATTFHLILAAYQLLLHKYSNQKDVIIGVPFANRMDYNTQEVMGLFMNMLPLRFCVQGEHSLHDVLDESRRESESAAAHQDIPFNLILDSIDYSRDTRANPLYQAVLSYQIYPHSHRNTLFSYSPIKVDYGVSKLDLNLWVEEDGDSVLFTLNYCTDLFERQTAERMLKDLQTLLAHFVSQPNMAVNEISFLSSSERQKLLQTCRPTSAQPITPIHHQFERQALNNPDAIAIRCEERSMTYRDLNEKANRLARRIKSSGVSKRQSVAILMEKTEHTIVSIFAVMKAGACYVPIDVTLPEQKIRFILQDSKTSCILIAGKSNQLTESLSLQFTYDCIDVIETHTDEMLSVSTNLELDDRWEETPAYIIYTSGSSGAPKGVCVSHAQISHYCRSISPILQQAPFARYGAFSSLTTDLAHTMVFPSLIGQGELVILTRTQLESPEKLAEFLEEYPLDCMKITPTHLSALLTSDCASSYLPKKLLVLGGERLPISLVKRVRALNPRCDIINHYGPTECTVGVTTYSLPSDWAKINLKYAPIGKPLSSSHVLILDEQGALVAPNMAGEICVGGDQLAIGYLGLTEETQKRFIAHPYIKGERLYRTGDKGRLLADGNLEYLGRLDRQCKIRGYRVELAGVEHGIQQLNYVRQVAVVQQSPGEEEARLVAYVVLNRDHHTGSEVKEQLKADLIRNLPSYMQPEAWVWLDALPMNASGKVNYRALPVAKKMNNVEDAEHDDVYFASLSTDSELIDQISTLYKQILRVDTLDLDKGFLALGGSSISALKLIIKLNKALNSNLTLGTLLENSSVRQLANAIEQQNHTPEQFNNSSLVTLNEGQSQDNTIVLIHPAGGNVLCYQNLVKELGDHWPIFGVQVADYQHIDDYHHSIPTLARHYVDQIGDIARRPGLILAGWSLGGTLAYEMAYQISQLSGFTPTVVVFDQPAPNVDIDGSAEMSEYERLAYFAHKVELFTGVSFGITSTALAELSEHDRSKLFLTSFQAAQLVPDNITLHDFQSFLAQLQAHMKATDEYQGRSYKGAIIVAEAKDTLPGRVKLITPGLGWQSYTEKPVTVIPAQGDHISMMNPPNIAHVALKIKEALL